MKTGKILLLTIATALISACSTPKNFNYLQDLTNGQVITTSVDGTIRLQPKDQISILVKSKDPLMSSLFNKGISTSMKSGQTDGNVYVTGYTLGPDGNIDFPVLGKIQLKSLSRYEAEQVIQKKLQEEQLKDANVTVEFMNLSYTITGEVNKPGVYPIQKDAVTLLEALGQAGDMGVYGKRDSIMVVRDVDGTRKAYVLGLNSAKDLLSSEAYYVRQNDIIYIKANDTKARQSTASGNETRSISFWLSLASVLTTIAVLVFK
ncbi:MAG: polysaccharide biosynthesis/export family protein [Prevotella sp.]|nr:polysaccharide biosynthesis/export family protein [Prevotella sp.]